MDDFAKINEIKRKIAGLDMFDDDELDKDMLKSFYNKKLKELGVEAIDIED